MIAQRKIPQYLRLFMENLMKKPLTLALALSLSTVGLTAPLLAGNGARAMSVHGVICPASKPKMRAWAASNKGHGSFAVPYIQGAKMGSCDMFVGYFPSSQSYGHKDAWLADRAALQHCEARKPSGFSGCAIVARSFPLR